MPVFSQMSYMLRGTSEMDKEKPYLKVVLYWNMCKDTNKNNMSPKMSNFTYEAKNYQLTQGFFFVL